MSDEQEEIDEMPPHVPDRGLVFVNAYAVTRHYGGPEEGGWYFNAGEPLASVPLPATKQPGHGLSLKGEPLYCGTCDPRYPDHGPCGDFTLAPDAEALRKTVKRLEESFADVAEGNIYSVLGGVEVQFSIQDHFARYWPEKRPHYE